MNEPMKPTDREVVVAEALVAVVDYAGRVLLSVGDLRYVAEKAERLAGAATRVARLIDAAVEAGVPIRHPVVDALVAEMAQGYVCGRRLFPLAETPDGAA